MVNVVIIDITQNNQVDFYALIFLFISGIIETPEDFQRFAIKLDHGPFKCHYCEYFHDRKSQVLFHIESKHFPNSFTYNCRFCKHTLKLRSTLVRHESKCAYRS